MVELTLRVLAIFCRRCDTLCVAILSNFTAAKSEAILHLNQTANPLSGLSLCRFISMGN